MAFTSAQIGAGTPDLGDGPLSLTPFLCPDYFARERDEVFGRAWLNVARGCEVPKPGDFVVRDVEIRDASVIVVRGKDDMVRAFHNVCAHRSAKVEWRRQGSCRLFSCPYHAWSYDTEGQLRGVPGLENFPGLDKAANGLTPIACEVWNDLVFINFEREPRESLHDFLGELTAFERDYPLADMEASATVEVAVVHCNWKVFLHAFLEAYHLNVLHGRSLGNTFNPPDNPNGDPLYYRGFGRHGCLTIGANLERRVGPMEVISQRHAADLLSTGGSARDSAFQELGGGTRLLNPTGATNWALEGVVLFPNVMWLAAMGSCTMHKVWPLDLERTRFESVTYYPRPRSVSERFARELRFALFRDTIVEDILNTEYSQRALKSGAKQSMQLQRGEIAIRHHYHQVDSVVRGETAHV